ncbi:MAG: hypothetical protein Q9174_001727 [Haloplaca sp. 1 TL-2023]
MAASTKAGLKDNPAMSFVMLTESQMPVQAHSNGKEDTDTQSRPSTKQKAPDLEPPGLAQQIQSTTRLFEILSAHSDIDHPICTECTDLLLSQLQSRLTAGQKDRDTYISYLKTLNSVSPAHSPSSLQKSQKSLAEARTAEAKAFSELLALEKEKENLDAEIASLEAESLALDVEEQDFWRERNAFALEMREFQNQRDALTAAYEHDSQQLERLQRTNVYNDCFCISHDGNFGTINGLRLGRLPPPQNVEWPEINAALGTTALLLATVAEKLGCEFVGYRIRPMGSTSHIEKFENASAPASQASSTATVSNQSSPTQSTKTTTLDLFSSGDLPLGGRFLHRRLDAGMVALLDCIRQLGEFVEHHSSPPSPPAAQKQPSGSARPGPRRIETASTDTSRGMGIGAVKLPYKIERDKIHDVSIRLGAGTDETWTGACKYALTCCKFLLAFASNVGAAGKR